MYQHCIIGIRGVQNFTGTDPTDWRRRHRPDCSADQMSRGRCSDFTLHSDASALKSTDWEIRNRAVAEPNRYKICSVFFLFFIFYYYYFFYEADKTTSYIWVLLKKIKKQNGAFYARFSNSQGYIRSYVSLSIF